MQRIWNILNFPIKFHFPLKFNFKPILICMLQRHIQRIRDLIAMKEEDRHSLLRYLTADEYRDIINVCSSLPYVTMEVHSTGIYIWIYNVHFQVFVSNVIIKVPSPHLSLAHRAPIPLSSSLSVLVYCSCLIIKVLHRDNILRVHPLYITIHVYTTIRYVLWLPKLNCFFLISERFLTCVS